MCCIPSLFSILCGFLLTSCGYSWRIIRYNITESNPFLRRELLGHYEIPVLFSTTAPNSVLFDDDYHLVVANRTMRPIVEMPNPEMAILLSIANIFTLFILITLTLHYSLKTRIIHYKMDLEEDEDHTKDNANELNNEEKTQLQKEIDQFKKRILEFDMGYVPNPNLHEINHRVATANNIRCDFRHVKCDDIACYTNGVKNYCWVHSIMIQSDKYK